MTRRVGLAGAMLVCGVVFVAGCGQGGAAAGRAGNRTRVPTPTAAVTGPTAAITPTPTPTPSRKPRVLKPGARGADVRDLQRRLKNLHYDPGKIDGRYGPTTMHAVWAFQKVNRLKRTTRVGKQVWSALDAPRAPSPLVKRAAADERVEIDLRKQLLYVYEDGEIVLITHISTGSGEYYCAKDFGATVPRCRYAGTPTGNFRTGRRASGWERSPLGMLYNPIYFNGGIAVHGAPSVPLYPASHGCVRIPLHTADLFPKLVGTGVRVHVRRPG